MTASQTILISLLALLLLSCQSPATGPRESDIAFTEQEQAHPAAGAAQYSGQDASSPEHLRNVPLAGWIDQTPPQFRDVAMQAGLMFQADLRAALIAWYRVHQALPAGLPELQQAGLLPFRPCHADGSPMAVVQGVPSVGSPAGWYIQPDPSVLHFCFFNGTERRATLAITLAELQQEMVRLSAATSHVGHGTPAAFARLEASSDPVLAFLRCRMEQLSTRCRQYVHLTGHLPATREAMEEALGSVWPAEEGSVRALETARANREAAVALRIAAAEGYWELEYIAPGQSPVAWRYTYTLNAEGQPRESVRILRPDDVPQEETSFHIWVMASPDSV